MNMYRNGFDKVAWHKDNKGGFKNLNGQTEITSLSLGAERSFQVKPAFDTANTYVRTIQLGHGSILHMDGYMQDHYLHQVPREPWVSCERMNFTFRWHDGAVATARPEVRQFPGLSHGDLVTRANALKKLVRMRGPHQS